MTSTRSTAPEFDLSQIGVTRESGPIEVTAEATRRFAEATNDLTPDYLEGRLAPPVFAVVAVLDAMVEVKRAVTTAFAVHGEHDIRIHEALRPGTTLRATARAVGVRQRSAGVATVILVESRDEGGVLLNRQHFTTFVAGARVERSVGEDPPPHVTPPGTRSDSRLVTYTLDPDQTHRFAAASNDWDAYTLDDAAARELGFPAKIVHGSCTMALAARALVAEICEGDASRLERLALRFARPLVLVDGQSLATRIWAAGDEGGVRIYGFEATDKEGETMVKHGWAEVAG